MADYKTNTVFGPLDVRSDAERHSDAGNPYDATVFGGHGYSRNANGNITDSGVDNLAVNYQNRGAAAAQRQAYRVNYAVADQERKLADSARTDQGQAISLMRGAALGQTPSRAAILGAGAADQSLQGQLAMQAGARGGIAQAAAQRQAYLAGNAQGIGAMGQYGGMRSAEMNQGLAGYMQGTGQVRASDYQQQELMQQRAAQQMKSELAQRQLNDQAQLSYEQMGQDTYNNAVQGELSKESIYNRAEAARRAADEAATARAWGYGAAVAGAAGTVAGGPVGGAVASGAVQAGSGASSDVRAKQDVMPLYEPDGQELHINNEGRAQLLSYVPQQTMGATLSGPTPRYSVPARAEAPKLSEAAAKKAKERKMTDEELLAAADREIARVKQQEARALAAGPAVRPQQDPMGNALDAMQPYQYRYREGIPGETPEQVHVGPMANPMAADPVASTAVTTNPQTGLLAFDPKGVQRLSLGGLGYLKQRQDSTDARLAALEGEK